MSRDDEMNDTPDGEDSNDENSDDDRWNDDDDDDSEDEHSKKSEEETKRERKRLRKETVHLAKSILVLNSLLNHLTRLQEIIAAISDAHDSGSKPSPKLIGERRYNEKQILFGINSLYEFDRETFEELSSEYANIATRLETSEEEEETQ